MVAHGVEIPLTDVPQSAAKPAVGGSSANDSADGLDPLGVSGGAETTTKKRRAEPKEPRDTRTLVVGLATLAALLVSITLAVGALLVALSVDARQSLVSAVFGISDFFAGPISGLFNFSDDSELDRERLVTFGVASLIYLLVGMVLSSRIERKSR